MNPADTAVESLRCGKRQPRLLLAVLAACLAGRARLRRGALPGDHPGRRGRPQAELKPIWRFFGADEPNYANMKDGRKLLGELGQLGSPQVYFRAHNLLTTGDGTPALKWGSTNAYTEDAQGKPVYDWRVLDRIFDTYRERGLKPYAQIGFMPQALSVKPEPYQHEWRPGLPYNDVYTGWAYPPKDYAKWAELVYQWVKHCVERYGRAEVESWYWEVWNEPNIGYWQGTPEEFHKLHDYAIDAVRRALPTRAGGRAGRGRPGRPVPARLPRALPARHQLRHGQDGHADRLHRLPRQGSPDGRGRPRADGHRPPAADDRR